MDEMMIASGGKQGWDGIGGSLRVGLGVGGVDLHSEFCECRFGARGAAMVVTVGVGVRDRAGLCRLGCM